jgi:hypothetical protein
VWCRWCPDAEVCPSVAAPPEDDDTARPPSDATRLEIGVEGPELLDDDTDDGWAG